MFSEQTFAQLRTGFMVTALTAVRSGRTSTRAQAHTHTHTHTRQCIELRWGSDESHFNVSVINCDAQTIESVTRHCLQTTRFAGRVEKESRTAGNRTEALLLTSGPNALPLGGRRLMSPQCRQYSQSSQALISAAHGHTRHIVTSSPSLNIV